ncbi:unnamed protein product [Durusdinium trenchii]|uniref:Uncharacterized protein n=1 Tax=Durusdinium trenchii TaxID=1381693 RepID=A0ABP0S0R1_9DINO
MRALGDLVEGRVIQISQEKIYIELAGQERPALLQGPLDFLPQLGDELVDLQVAGLHEGEITLLLAAEEEEEKELEDIADAQAKGGKGAIKGTKGTKGYGQDERVGFMYTKQQLLECRAAVLRDGKTVQLASLSQCPEEELETTLVRALLAGDLPPAWWSKRTMPLKRQALRVALRVANMQAVYAMQPESLQFREALSCYEPDDRFLEATLSEIWADGLLDSDLKPERGSLECATMAAWSSTSATASAALPKAAEAIEWLLLRGAPASVLLPEEPGALKARMKALRLLRDLGPVVCPAVAAAVAGCLRDPEVKGRRAAAQSLAALGPSVAKHAPRAIPRLLRLFRDPDPLCAEDAAVALGHLGTDALGAAVAELRSAEGSTAVGVKALACRALGEAGHEAAAFGTDLLELLQSEHAVLRASASQALGRIGAAHAGDLSLCSLLAHLATEDQDCTTREAAVTALGLLATEVKRAEAQGELEVVRAALASALDDVETFVREAAALALQAAA